MALVKKTNQHIMYENKYFVVVGDAKDAEEGTILYNPKKDGPFISGVKLGVIYREVDGYYHWDCNDLQGAWSLHALQEIVTMLDIINKPWDDRLKEYFEKEKESDG